MNEELRWIAEVTGARSVTKGERIQSLWSGFGELFRVHLIGGDDRGQPGTAIVKCVTPPAHDRTGDRAAARSHARKVRSYEVETAWYRFFASRCDDACRVAKLFGSRASAHRLLLVLEDLDAAGFDGRVARRSPKAADLDVCLAWLAEFHARFLGRHAQEGLWKSGTYWHLATRPDELAAIEDDALREAAPVLDQKLRGAKYQTLVHGDAKLANFCFGHTEVAAVDFQYVGGGCGMKDVAYLLSGDAGSEAAEQQHLDTYFRCLRAAVMRTRMTANEGNAIDVDALEHEWRALYPIACADFYRFLAGWAKPHWRSDSHGQRVVRNVLRALA